LTDISSTKYFFKSGFLGTGAAFYFGGKHMAMSWGTKIKKKKAKVEKKKRPGFSFRGKRTTWMMLEVVPWARGQYIDSRYPPKR
jgi:hypothetical protein